MTWEMFKMLDEKEQDKLLSEAAEQIAREE